MLQSLTISPKNPNTLPITLTIKIVIWVLLLVSVVIAFMFSEAYAEQERECRLLMLGDSITAGYGLRDRNNALPKQLEKNLKNSGYRVEVMNGGVSGDTTRNLLDRLQWAMQTKPDATIVAIGGNDILRVLNPTLMAQNIEKIVRYLVEDAQKPTALVGIYVPASMGSAYQNEVKQAYTQVAQSYDIALQPNIFEGILGNRDYFQPDGIHPNAQGAKIIADTITPLAKDVIKKGCYSS